MPVTYQRQGRIIRRGASHFGEILVLQKLNEELDRIGDRQTRILCNVVVPDTQVSREVDLLVVGPFGVTTIEVKYFNDPVEFIGQSKTQRVVLNGSPIVCKPEPREQAARSARCVNSLLKQFRINDMGNAPIAVNGILLFANDHQVLKGDPGRIVSVELLKTGIQKIVSGEMARTKFSANWKHKLSDEQIDQVVDFILGCKTSEPTRTIDRYELIDELNATEPYEFRARCALPSAPKSEEFRLRCHRMGPIPQDNERQRVWRLVWREYQALRKLAKEHVRGIPLPHDPFFDPDDDTVAWTVSDYIPGATLNCRISQKALPIGPTLAQIATILSNAHTGGVLHRQLTPDALWIASSDDSPWILHWDFARLHEEQTIASQIRDRIRQRSHYIAPEVRERPERVSQASDLYSFGVIAAELCFGESLQSDDPSEPLLMLRKKRPGSLACDKAQALLASSLSIDPHQRGDLALLGAALKDVDPYVCFPREHRHTRHTES